MTRKEAIKLLIGTKVYVKDKSEEIQKKAIELGFNWLGLIGKTTEHDKPFLFFNEKMQISFGVNVHLFNICKYRELDADYILSIKIDEPTYRPFKDASECWNEMLKHKPFGWVKEINSERLLNIRSLSDIDIVTVATKKYTTALSEISFADGAPFGIKEE